MKKKGKITMGKNRSMAAKQDKAKKCACYDALDRQYSIMASGSDICPSVNWAMNHKPSYSGEKMMQNGKVRIVLKKTAMEKPKQIELSVTALCENDRPNGNLISWCIDNGYFSREKDWKRNGTQIVNMGVVKLIMSSNEAWNRQIRAIFKRNCITWYEAAY